MQIVAWILKYFFKLEMMSGGDEAFFQDDSRNKLNIIAYKKYQKFKTEEIRKKLFERACDFPRIRSCVVKFLGKYMFYDMGKEFMM